VEGNAETVTGAVQDSRALNDHSDSVTMFIRGGQAHSFTPVFRGCYWIPAKGTRKQSKQTDDHVMNKKANKDDDDEKPIAHQ